VTLFSRRAAVVWLVGAAAAAGPLAAAAQTAEDPAAASIKAFYAAVESASGATDTDPKARFDALSDPVMKTFDLAAMTRLAIGPPWSKIPAPKQTALQDAFGRYFIATYASRLGAVAGGRFEVMPNPDARPNGRLVRTRITDKTGRETRVDYLVDAQGKVTDIYLDGTVSELAAMRAQFDMTLKSGGPDALETSLRQRVDKLLAGK
jgi:phospholipid transport system substrate-binding protein